MNPLQPSQASSVAYHFAADDFHRLKNLEIPHLNTNHPHRPLVETRGSTWIGACLLTTFFHSNPFFH